MNLAQSIGVAAAALAVGFYPQLSGLNEAAAQVQGAAAQSEAMTRAAVRNAVNELADLLEDYYVFPEHATRYANHLRTRLAAGAYDDLTDPQALASSLQAELRGVHQDAHLRINLTEVAARQPNPMRQPDPNYAQARWLGDNVAYLSINGLPGDEASVQRMRTLLAEYADARALVIDLRRCPGGGGPMMNEIFAHLYAEPTRVMIMDTRTSADAMMMRNGSTPNMRRVDGPTGIARYENWAMPTNPVSSLADARVYVLTGRTGSACEHLAQALRETGRATLVGSNTAGAGHYGMGQQFANGRFEMFLPVGNSYAPGAQSWEGVGVAPHRQVNPDDALNVVMQELGLRAPTQLQAHAPDPNVTVVEGAPANRRYGMMVAPPRGGESTITIQQLAPGGVALAAGVRPGDRIVSLNGAAIGDIPAAEFGNYMRASPLRMVVERDGERLTFEMSLD